MDERGFLHELPSDDKTRKEYERRLGQLVPVPPDELEAVQAMPIPERRAWYAANLTREQKNQRKRARRAQRDARKRQRRHR